MEHSFMKTSEEQEDLLSYEKGKTDLQAERLEGHYKVLNKKVELLLAELQKTNQLLFGNDLTDSGVIPKLNMHAIKLEHNKGAIDTLKTELAVIKSHLKILAFVSGAILLAVIGSIINFLSKN